MKTKQKTNRLEPYQQTALSILEQPGQPLDAQTRAILEPRFSHNFADVRVHADGAAARAATDFGARAFAVGQDIVMNAGEYDPRSRAGLELLTHELTHTIQQRGARGDAPLEIAKRSSGMEVEARETRDRVMGGGSAPSISSGASLSVARDDDPTASNISDLLALPGMLVPGLDLAGQAIGFAGNLQKGLEGGTDASASSGQQNRSIASGLLGIGGNIASMVGNIGSDTLGAAGNVFGGLAGAANFGQGVMDAATDWEKGDYFKAVAGDGAKAVGGGLSGLASLGGFSLLGEAGFAGLAGAVGNGGLGVLGTVGGVEGSALTMGAGSALAGEGLSGLAALGPAGAVIGAGAAGVATGIALDQVTGKVMRGTGAGGWMDRHIDAALDFTGAGAVMDSVGGGSSAAGSRGDYTISDMMARGMTGADQLVTAGMRGAGLVDETRPAYTQTLGWRLAEALPSWMQ